MQKDLWAHIVIALITFGLFALSLHMLQLPNIALFNHWFYSVLPPAELMLCFVVALAWFRAAAAQLLLRATLKITHGLSALIVVLAMSSEGFMHALSIPHVEGWWLPLIGSGALATYLSVWFYKNNHRTDP
jgi:hypothetical protein